MVEDGKQILTPGSKQPLIAPEVRSNMPAQHKTAERWFASLAEDVYQACETLSHVNCCRKGEFPGLDDNVERFSASLVRCERAVGYVDGQLTIEYTSEVQ
jgi:hypothetical protein